MDAIKIVVRPVIEQVIAKVPIDVVIPAQLPYPLYCFSAFCQRGNIKFKQMTVKLSDDGLVMCSWRNKPDEQEKELLLDYGVFFELITARLEKTLERQRQEEERAQRDNGGS